MPFCRRKRVVLIEPSDDLVHALQTDPERQVFYLQETGEIFESYECVFFSYPTPFQTIFFFQGLRCTHVLLSPQAVPV